MADETVSQAAHLLLSRRRQVAGSCLKCGKPIQGTVRRKYCGNTCAVAAHRARKAKGEDKPR